jgi:hypothetical protein
VTAEVEPAPPGFGAWDLPCCGFPFLLFGALGLYVARRRRRRAGRENPALADARKRSPGASASKPAGPPPAGPG